MTFQIAVRMKIVLLLFRLLPMHAGLIIHHVEMFLKGLNVDPGFGDTSSIVGSPHCVAPVNGVTSHSANQSLNGGGAGNLTVFTELH